MAAMNFEGMGRYIYGAARFGGDLVDVADWMADDLGVARPQPGDDDAARGLYGPFFAKYADPDALRDNFERFMTVLKSRPPSAGRVRGEVVPRRIESPKFIASERVLWLRADGSETIIEAKIGEPYQVDERTWACPACLDGVDGRYPEIVGASSMQALTLALDLLRTILGHMLESNAQLVYPEDRSPWDMSALGLP